MQNEREHRMTDVYARLAPGATPMAAQAELRQIAGRLHATYPEAYPRSSGFDTIVTPWKDELTSKARPTLMVLLVTTLFVLIIACANVGNLTLTRLVQRERELAVRAALGASGSVLRRQLLAENLVLSMLGGALGLGLAVAGIDLLIRYTARFTARTGEIALDWRVLAFTLAVSIALALLFAWAPRLTFLTDPVKAMSGAGGRVAGSRGRRRTQRLLVVSQLAASFMLLVGAGLLTRSLFRLYAVDPGFNLTNVLSLQAPDFRQPNRERRQQFGRDVLERVGAETAVQSTSLASQPPLGGSFPQQLEFRVDGASSDALAAAPQTVIRVVSSGYFNTVGTPITLGRAFTTADRANTQPVVILSESMARFFLKDLNPIGRHISWKQNGTWTPATEIVGVAADTHAEGITREPRHTLYQPDTQAPFVPTTILVRSAGKFDQLTPRIVEMIRQLDPDRPIDHVQTLEELRDESIAPQRLNAVLIGLFALLALAIATVGVAGVLAFSVSQRTNELGIRLALGAERGSILRMILGEGLMMGGVGLTIGAMAAVPLSRFLSGLLFGVQPADPVTLVAAAALLLGVAIVAAWIPARLATSVDPLMALRSN
jgi:putative ABC transport system permease protein